MTDTSELERLRRLARFPSENPNPVMRVSREGVVELPNRPCAELLSRLGCEAGEEGNVRVPDRWLDTIDEARETASAREITLDVGERIFNLGITPVADADYVYVYGRDVTERARAERDLITAKDAAETANRTKSAFLANMSHELRTPLNAILGYCQLLREEVEDAGDDAYVSDLDKIQTAGKHLLGVISQILDLSKIEAGKMELHYETFDVQALLEDVVATSEPLVKKRDNELVVRLEDDLGAMHADLSKVRQVLINLASNAAKFTSNGTVTIQALRERSDDGRDWLQFSVADTGIGMTEEELDRVFEPFTQADSSTVRQFGGTGLGLSITKRFCEMLQGRLEVVSEKDRGTRFSVWIPARLDAEVVPVLDQLVSALGKSSAPGARRVLAVDDDPAVLEVLARTLAREGYEVHVARDGESGIELARELEPAAITLDVMMPHMDGWAVLARLKSDPELAKIPVIMLTMVDEKGAGLALGAADYLSKPIERDQLIRVLERHTSAGGAPVLVVDDEPDQRELLRRLLEKEGASVVEAVDGQDALEKIEASEPSLILLDLRMPHVDGFEVVERLRAQANKRTIPIVVVTGKSLTKEERGRLEGLHVSTIEKQGVPEEEILSRVRDVVRAQTGPA